MCMQVVEVVEGPDAKLRWLLSRISGFVDQGDVLVFANQKAKVEEVLQQLQAAGASRFVEARSGVRSAYRQGGRWHAKWRTHLISVCSCTGVGVLQQLQAGGAVGAPGLQRTGCR